MGSMNIQKIRQQLAGLTAGQKKIRVGDTTVEEVLGRLGVDGSLAEGFNRDLSEDQLILLGRLSTMLDVLAVQRRRMVLVRWFE
jgi:hypothetical protein